nr:heparinase II/III family protein [Bacteroides sp. 51]
MISVCIGLFLSIHIQAQHIALPEQYPQGHPRVLTTAEGKETVHQLIQKEAWAKDVFEKIKSRTDRYADREPEWLVSRLQMYWNSRAVDIFIKGEVFSHAGGEAAPVPTVRYTGTRAATSAYARPALEEVLPYMDDERGVFFHNKAKEGRPLEWVAPAETGRNIESINREIMAIARDAAFLWWFTGEQKYAALAREVFDTYMTGIYYRNVPIDLNNGHQQTLVGLASFEVIHEDILNELVPLYDFLYDDLSANKREKMPVYAAAFKKWADNIIDNGVPHNNWNLFQALYILNIGLVLEDDNQYTDGKGRQYYIDYVLNKNSIRQWSLPKLIDYGFDKQTGIWAECPGYSINVVADFCNFVDWFDRNLNYDILPQLPVLERAVSATPQYLFPNHNIVGFGDTHPGKLRTDIFHRMISNAQRYDKKEQEQKFTAMLKLFDPHAASGSQEKKNVRADITSFFTDKPLMLDPDTPAGKIEDYVSSTFWAPNVSWFVQRNGMSGRNSLMISLNGSEGNHMHANGISMELYGKGFPLAPDAGIGTGYFALDYAEYYGQFPSHNTVCVDGISSYPIMKSNHAFELLSCYPQPEIKEGIYRGVTYSDVYFREPETRADQTRLMSIVTTSPTTGYYVDVFRSRKEKGGDKMHDYFYHNLGQNMELTASDGRDLNLQPTEELAFAGAHLYAYSYIFDKKSTKTDKDVKATFTMRMPDGDDIYMNMWMKGEEGREVFSALSPMCEGLSRTPGMPYNVKEQPTLTYVARQTGEAWTRPFVSVFEPSSKNEPSGIASVSFFNAETKADDCAGICVENKNGRIDYIFSQGSHESTATYKQITATGTYALVGVEKNDDCVLFLGNGTQLKYKDITILSANSANLTLERKNGDWYIATSSPCTVTIGKKKYKVGITNYRLL